MSDARLEALEFAAREVVRLYRTPTGLRPLCNAVERLEIVLDARPEPGEMVLEPREPEEAEMDTDARPAPAEAPEAVTSPPTKFHGHTDFQKGEYAKAIPAGYTDVTKGAQPAPGAHGLDAAIEALERRRDESANQYETAKQTGIESAFLVAASAMGAYAEALGLVRGAVRMVEAPLESQGGVELAQFRKEEPIFDALMIELKGSWPQYEHYRTLLNEARGFPSASQGGAA